MAALARGRVRGPDRRPGAGLKAEPTFTAPHRQCLERGRSALHGSAAVSRAVQFHVAAGRLSCQLYQRSADIFRCALQHCWIHLTHLVAQVCGLGSGIHPYVRRPVLYLNHRSRPAAERDPRPLPRLGWTLPFTNWTISVPGHPLRGSTPDPGSGGRMPGIVAGGGRGTNRGHRCSGWLPGTRRPGTFQAPDLKGNLLMGRRPEPIMGNPCPTNDPCAQLPSAGSAALMYTSGQPDQALDPARAMGACGSLAGGRLRGLARATGMELTRIELEPEGDAHFRTSTPLSGCWKGTPIRPTQTHMPVYLPALAA